MQKQQLFIILRQSINSSSTQQENFFSVVQNEHVSAFRHSINIALQAILHTKLHKNKPQLEVQLELKLKLQILLKH